MVLLLDDGNECTPVSAQPCFVCLGDVDVWEPCRHPQSTDYPLGMPSGEMRNHANDNFVNLPVRTQRNPDYKLEKLAATQCDPEAESISGGHVVDAHRRLWKNGSKSQNIPR